MAESGLWNVKDCMHVWKLILFSSLYEFYKIEYM